ncbi:LLM class flavin-dependent oxidoreductase [Streptomyces sp. NPDC047725]|uniref:LLM class flavin-dependent oxidoreductase n=1 Tax=Streptomyces sp. NPDC047725 TaxID=3365487 RepID=UPI00372034E1
MTPPKGRRRLHLAAALDQPSAYDAGSYVDAARLAERGGLDFVTLGDGFGRPGPDALAVLARVAPATRRVGLVPTVTTTHTDPVRVQAAVAALDLVSRGRAGWRIEVSAAEAEARLSGRHHTASAEELWREAGEAADIAARLWDSPEDGADIPDGACGRFADPGRQHPVDCTCSRFRVRGPSTGPRPPQGHPVRVVDATGKPARAVAALHADVALVRTAHPARAAAARAELRASAAAHGRDPDALRVLAALDIDLGGGEYAARPGHGGGGPRPTPRGPLYRGGPVDLAELIAVWHREGTVDGFHLTPAEPRRDLERLVNGTVPLLQHRGLFRTFYPGSTLRDHLGLRRPANRDAVAGGAS